MSADLVRRYYDAFNAKDTPAMLACLHPEVTHHVNEGEVRVGHERFAAFCAHMARCYDETLSDVVILSAPDAPGRFAAEFTVTGTYLSTDGDLPAARGQTYVLPAGAFLTVDGGAIVRLVTYYNLADWLRQVA